MSPVAPSSVRGGVSRDGVQPRSESTIRLKLVTLQMYLQERDLKHVLGQLGAPQVSAQIIEQLAFVAIHQLRKLFPVTAGTVVENKLLVSHGV
jgi:hypothetical protein